MATVAFATPALEKRANTILGIITFTASECTGTEAAGSTQYFTTDGPCKNVPPIPNETLVPFLSFGTGFMQPAGFKCELQVFAEENCAGQHEGFSNPNIKCQNVGIGITSQAIAGTLPMPKVGAKSIKLTCTPAWSRGTSRRILFCIALIISCLFGPIAKEENMKVKEEGLFTIRLCVNVDRTDESYGNQAGHIISIAIFYY